MNTEKRKRQEEEEDFHDVKRKTEDESNSVSRQFQHEEIRYDFSSSVEVEDEDESSLLANLAAIKQQLNDVKALLSDKDIADWNRHTAYMNAASTIVPYLREKLNIEVGTQAWGKMFEILANFDLVNNKSDQKWITLHLCEAPGAFISALNHFLVTREETQHIQWRWFAQTLNPYYEHDESTAAMLIDDDRLIFHTIGDDHWDFGIDNSGNLMNQANIDHYISRFQPMGINLITADGSFDVQSNPGEQELLVYPLLKTEVYVALSCLLTNGNFVLKLFTMFEQKTIDLIYLLYRTFRQISMFKPKTSKKGNSEVYLICLGFDREKFTDCFSDNLQLNSSPYSLSFLHQLIQCSQLFQSNQMNTIEHNLNYFHNLSRKFMKKLHRIKDATLDRFLNQCQVRQLLSTDRHLLKTDLESRNFLQSSHTISRTGTFNNQHETTIDMIQEKIQNGSFCLICSRKNDNEIIDLCDTCQTVSRIVSDRSLSVNQIYIGQILANQKTIIDYVFGKQSINIRNSCFSSRFLLELCSKIDVNRGLLDEGLIDYQSIRNSSSIEISNEQFHQLQRFAADYQINLQYQKGVYYVHSAPILTRLQASVIYILTRTFEQTSVYVIPSTSPHLLFLFEKFQETINDEYHQIVQQQQILPSTDSTLLQFVHIHQLLNQHFAFNLMQANNICLQLEYVT